MQSRVSGDAAHVPTESSHATANGTKSDTQIRVENVGKRAVAAQRRWVTCNVVSNSGHARVRACCVCGDTAVSTTFRTGKGAVGTALFDFNSAIEQDHLTSKWGEVA